MDWPLEPTPQELEALTAAVARFAIDHVETLAQQPSADTDDVAPLLAALAEPAPEAGRPLTEILDRLGPAVAKSFNTAGPGYLAFIPGGGIYSAALADFLACATNRYVGVRYAAPALVKIEETALRWLADLMGYPAGARGVLTSGGSLSNLAAIFTARIALLPEDDLLRGTLYVTEETHRCVAKAARLAGFPARSVRLIGTDSRYRMRADALDEAVREDRARGLRPFLVVASVGTTNTGAIDPLPAILDVARPLGLWVHADAAYGGFFRLADGGAALMPRLQECDSITLDPHKGLFLPYGTGCLLVKDGEALRRAHADSADYLQDVTGEEPGFNDLSAELSRDFRGLRLWLPIQLHGLAPFRAALREKLALARWAYEELRADPRFEILDEPQLSVIAFRLKGEDAAADARNQELLRRVNARKRVFLSSTRMGGRYLLRICVLSFRTHADRVQDAVEALREEAAALLPVIGGMGCLEHPSSPRGLKARLPEPPLYPSSDRESSRRLAMRVPRLPRLFFVLALAVALAHPAAADVQAPEQFFGFKIGSDGELARYPRIVEYLQQLAKNSDRVRFRELGRTTLDNAFVLATFSSPQNLARFDELVKINRRLSDPRGLSEAEARKLASEGRPFYLVYATIHATEVGNTQALVEVAHRLASEDSREVKQMLDDAVLLMVPSQNPDGQVLVIDHWYKTKGTSFDRQYPDLYHHYTGHDNNRDWFMLTQKETRLMVEKVQNALRPVITLDMHQQGPAGSRIFTPPFDDPYDPNIHPILAAGQAQVGLAMAGALVAAGKTGVEYQARYDLWAPARQYMVYHGQPRILTEIASARIADPFVNPRGADQPLGPQEPRWNYLQPYGSGEWRLRQIVDYGKIALFAGLEHVAKNRESWLLNFYRVHRDWVERKDAPYAFVISADQRDPYETWELLEILRAGDVEVQRAKSAFSAGGSKYPAGSWVVLLAQPYGAWAKTMLERQRYPDLRSFPGGPPKPPYDVAGHTLGMLMGVDVQQVEARFDAELQKVETLAPRTTPVPKRPSWAYLVPPESNAGFLLLARLQKAGVPAFRAARAFDSGGRRFAPGTWVVPPSDAAAGALEAVAKDAGLPVFGADQAPAVDGWALAPRTRIGLWRAANNMPGGWLKWLFERYGFEHSVVSAADFTGDPGAKHDVIVLPSGTSRDRIVRGLDPKRNAPEWSWAYGIGDAGWTKLRDFVRNGGTLVAVGTAVETARQLLELPIEKALPESQRRRGAPDEPAAAAAKPTGEQRELLKQAFQSPARLASVLDEYVIEPESQFYCPGSLLANEFDVASPIAYGMPERWPVFFETNQAYRILPGFGMQAQAAARYPKEGKILESGWLLGEEYLRGQANVIAFKVGKGTAVVMASEVDYRTQPRATFKLLFNGIYQGGAAPVTADGLKRLTRPSPTAN